MQIVAANACVTVERLVLGPLDNNIYFISDGESLLVVDPAIDVRAIISALKGRSCDAILLTHTHWDHVGAACALRNTTGATVIANADEAAFIRGDKQLGPVHHQFKPCPVDNEVANGVMFEVGAMKWRAMATPGHTPGSMCFFLSPEYNKALSGAPVLVSGDTLFRGTHGRTDFVGGSNIAMEHSLQSLLQLPEDTIVLPGHNDLTTIADERRTFSHLVKG